MTGSPFGILIPLMVQVSLQSLCVLGRKSSKFRQNLVDVNTKYSYFEKVVGKKDKSARDNLTALRHFYASFPSLIRNGRHVTTYFTQVVLSFNIRNRPFFKHI